MIQDLSFDSAKTRNPISRYFISQNSSFIRWACDEVDTKLNLQIEQIIEFQFLLWIYKKYRRPTQKTPDQIWIKLSFDIVYVKWLIKWNEIKWK